MQKRVIGIDIVRGWALLLMMIYHILYYIDFLHIAHIELRKDTLWIAFHLLILILFISLVGVSLKLTHSTKINWQKVKKRAILLGASSALITAISYIIFPHAWVYFGILHFIFVASILALPFLNYPYIAISVAIFIFIGSATHFLNTHWLFQILQQPLHLPTRRTMDLVRFFPWFGVVLIGVALVGFGLHQKIFNYRFFTAKNGFNRVLMKMGQHSLLIYLIHQPILFGLCILIKKILY